MGRARPRDFFDVAPLLDQFGSDRLLELAVTKGAGFTIETFLDALRAIARLTLADWAEDGISGEDANGCGPCSTHGVPRSRRADRDGLR